MHMTVNAELLEYLPVPQYNFGIVFFSLHFWSLRNIGFGRKEAAAREGEGRYIDFHEQTP